MIIWKLVLDNSCSQNQEGRIGRIVLPRVI